MAIHAQPLLDVKNLHAGFHIEGRFYHAVDGISFSVKPKQVLGMVGESGCGKSVTALSIMQLLPKENGEMKKGEILFKGERLDQFRESEMRRIRGREIAMIFQEPMTALNPVFSIGFQLQEAMLNHFPMSKKEAREKSIRLLRDVGIPRPETIVREYPHQLSGGMRQRVMIAMAIACRPSLLIADEPTTALDVTIQAQMLDLLREIQEKNEMSVLLVTHDLGVVAEICDFVIVMYAGKIVEAADVDTLFANPKHPYTKQLMRAVPTLETDEARLAAIDGTVPSLVNMPRTGCRFAARCPEAKPECRSETPELIEVEEGHETACLLYQNDAASGVPQR